MRAVILVASLLSGCATFDYPKIDYSNAPPVGWPDLKQEITYGSEAQVRQWCAPFPVPPGNKVGCALVYFDSGVCRIFLTTNEPELVKHERDHCLGYVHNGDGDLARRALEMWKRK